MTSMAGRALRVLGLAGKWLDGRASFEVAAAMLALEAGYTFVGFVGMIDPPRPEVAAAIEGARWLPASAW